MCFRIPFHPSNPLPLTPLHPIFPPRMWRSVFSDPQLAYWVQVKLNYWGMFPCSMAGPVGLSMGALPLHWQPGDFHFEGGRWGSSFQTTFPCNSHCLCSVHWYGGAVSQSSRFNDVYVWGTSQDLASLRRSVTAGHPAQLRVLWIHSSPQPALHLSSPTNSTWELFKESCRALLG